MPAELEVWSETLRSAARGWRSQQSELRAVRRDLSELEDAAAEAGPRVAPALRGYTDTWITYFGDQARAAEQHADALDGASSDFDHTDSASARGLENLLSWEDRNAAPGEVGPGTGVR